MQRLLLFQQIELESDVVDLLLQQLHGSAVCTICGEKRKQVSVLLIVCIYFCVSTSREVVCFEVPAEITSYLSCCSCCSFSLRMTAGTCCAPPTAIEGRTELEPFWHPCQLVNTQKSTTQILACRFFFFKKRKQQEKFLAAPCLWPDCRVAADDGNLISQGTNVPQMLDRQFALFHLEKPRRRRQKWTEATAFGQAWPRSHVFWGYLQIGTRPCLFVHQPSDGRF